MKIHVILASAVLALGLAYPHLCDTHPQLAPLRGHDASDVAGYPATYRANRAAMERLGAAGATGNAAHAAALRRLARSGRHFVAFDPRGDGRAVEAFGDVARARRIAVVVPGNGWTLWNLGTRPASDPGTDPDADGRALYRQMRARARGGHVAVLVWLGYDTPEDVDLVSAESARAAVGARLLRDFLARLPRSARVTLACHSYGTVVCGRVTRTVRVTNLVALASPGMDAASARRLRATVWAARATDDPIRFVPHVRVAGIGHGADPVSPAFGARVLGTGGGRGHSQYYRPGGTSLREITDIALGRYRAVWKRG